jgi:hypothetical protein
MQKRHGGKGLQIDWRSLRWRGTLAVGTLSLAMALGWFVLSLGAAHSRRVHVTEADVAGTARVLARSFEASGLVESLAAEGRLSDLARSVAQDLRPGSSVRIVQPDPAVASLIGKTPHQPQTAAFHVIGTSLEQDPATSVDYLPQMDPALTEGRTVVLHQGNQAVAYAPVRDEWNHALALIRVAETFGRGFWARLGDVFWRLVVALGCAALVTKATDQVLRRHATNLVDLARGYAGAVLERPFLSTEVLELAQRIAGPSAARALPESAPSGDASTAPVEEKSARRAAVKRQIFEPRKLVERIVLPVRGRAAEKGIEVSIVAGADVPRRLIGSPRALAAALNVLLENAVSHTRSGTIQVRVTRVLERPEYRFEVVDSGVGIPWQFQPSLDETVRKAAGRDPRQFRGLERVSAIAARLGGELGFESQPGSGSRFFLTARCEPVEVAASALPIA